MSDERGLYQKYVVKRVDGTPIAGPIFVLELGRDPYAVYGLKGYLESLDAAKVHPALADDLREIVDERLNWRAGVEA